jgi:hypothetical protein
MKTSDTATKTKWVIDPMHSEIVFKVRHLIIANVKYTTLPPLLPGAIWSLRNKCGKSHKGDLYSENIALYDTRGTYTPETGAVKESCQRSMHIALPVLGAQVKGGTTELRDLRRIFSPWSNVVKKRDYKLTRTQAMAYARLLYAVFISDAIY